MRAQGILVLGESLLLARHARRDQRYWVLPGGHREPGETLAEALARELAEEAGVLPTGFSLFSISEVKLAHREVLDVSFRILAFEGDPRLGPSAPELPDRRLEALELIPLDGIPDLDFRPAGLGRAIHAAWAAGDWQPVGYLGDLTSR